MSHTHNELHGAARAVGRVGIIGASPTGLGIARCLMDAGVPVTLFELERESLDNGVALARSGDQHDGRTALLAGTVNFHHLKDCDLIVDAASTDTAGKEKLFRRLDQVARPGAVLMTHACHAGVDRIAGCTRRPGNVLGLHVADAPDAGNAWTIVPGKDTSSGTLGTVTALARRLNKAATVCDKGHGIAPGTNGAASWDIDRAQE